MWPTLTYGLTAFDPDSVSDQLTEFRRHLEATFRQERVIVRAQAIELL